MADRYKSLKLSSQLCFPLYLSSKEIVRTYKKFLDKYDLTYTQYITMMVIWEEESLYVKELGNKLYLDSGTLTPVLKKLESKGLIKRERCSKDERNLCINITDKGRDLKDLALDIPKKMGNCINLNEEEKEQLFLLLEKITIGLTEENIEE